MSEVFVSLEEVSRAYPGGAAPCKVANYLRLYSSSRRMRHIHTGRVGQPLGLTIRSVYSRGGPQVFRGPVVA
jgi:hypothetical protein